MKNISNLIFLITFLLILISISYGISLTTNTKQTLKIATASAKNEYKKISYYKKENLDRYKKYQKENKNLPPTQVVTDVNIGLDQPHYTIIKESTKLNNTSILVNKYTSLPKDYVPKNLETINLRYAKSGMQLVSEARKAFEDMAEAAKAENLTIIAMSTYRSYEYQTTLYNNYVAQDGKEKADTYSARPGHSEHQTGLAVDVYNGKIPYTNFDKTEEFKWMQENAYTYGFILRYPKDKVKQTGYQYESWHYRYVGNEIAEYIYKTNLTYDEYYVQYIND